ncbi:MAG TPA: hypothetical protein VIY49_12430 [Bryobacteraceae bacterium]
MQRTNTQNIKLWWLLVAFVSGMAVAMFAEELILRAHDTRLEFAPQIHFLSGAPLARLHNAAEVPFDMKATVWSPTRDHVFTHNEEQFVVSFDIWEEKFSVITKTKAPSKTASHLSAEGLESWCMNQMSLDLTGMGGSDPFWARLEIRAESPEKEAGLFGRGSIGESGISLSSLIDIFSRPPHAQQLHWSLDSPRWTLDELRRRKS